MEKVKRQDISDYMTYQETRNSFRERVLEVKKPRRVHLGPNLSFLFENRETIIYQIQEMMRIERIVKEADIQHEIDTYNSLVGGDGELGCTLLIEIADEKEREEKLIKWLNLPHDICMTFDDGSEEKPQFDKAQVGDDRLSSVQYFIFNVGDRNPKGLRAVHPNGVWEKNFSSDTIEAFCRDLGR